MALPSEIKTTYAGYEYDIRKQNLSGYAFAEQCQRKLVAKYSTVTPYTAQVFQDILADISTDIEYNESNLFPKHKINNPAYPNWLKIAYQVVTRIGQNFESSAIIAGYVNGMSYLQLFELLFPYTSINLSDANPDNPE